MSRLLWFLTGAGNVDNIQCPQRKADRDKGGGGGEGVFIPTQVFIFKYYAAFRETTLWFLSKQA